MPTPTLDTNRVDIEAIVRDFASRQPAESFFAVPQDFSVATGDVFEGPQGYFFAHPMPFAEAMEYLAGHTRDAQPVEPG